MIFRFVLKRRHPQLFRVLNTLPRLQSHERTASTDGLADELIFRVCRRRPLVNVTKERVRERVKKHALVNMSQRNDKLGIAALAKSCKEPQARMALPASGLFAFFEASTCKCHERTRM